MYRFSLMILLFHSNIRNKNSIGLGLKSEICKETAIRLLKFNVNMHVRYVALTSNKWQLDQRQVQDSKVTWEIFFGSK